MLCRGAIPRGAFTLSEGNLSQKKCESSARVKSAHEANKVRLIYINIRERKVTEMISILELPMSIREAICEEITESGLLLLGIPTMTDCDIQEGNDFPLTRERETRITKGNGLKLPIVRGY